MRAPRTMHLSLHSPLVTRLQRQPYSQRRLHTTRTLVVQVWGWCLQKTTLLLRPNACHARTLSCKAFRGRRACVPLARQAWLARAAQTMCRWRTSSASLISTLNFPTRSRLSSLLSLSSCFVPTGLPAESPPTPTQQRARWWRTCASCRCTSLTRARVTFTAIFSLTQLSLSTAGLPGE